MHISERVLLLKDQLRTSISDPTTSTEFGTTTGVTSIANPRTEVTTNHVRSELNRVLCKLEPVRLVLTGEVFTLEAVRWAFERKDTVTWDLVLPALADPPIPWRPSTPDLPETTVWSEIAAIGAGHVVRLGQELAPELWGACRLHVASEADDLIIVANDTPRDLDTATSLASGKPLIVVFADKDRTIRIEGDSDGNDQD